MLKNLFCLLFISFTYFISAQQTALITAGGNWKYLDNGTNQGTIWTQTTFNDASWASGNAELGYGDGDEATVVSFGPSSSNKYITSYFRKVVNVVNPSQYFSLDLQAVRDDGIVVYINGTEVWRDNMPGGTISHVTPANSTISFGAESAWNQITISSAYLVNGNNTIAVEIHQENGGSSDISFNLRLNGNLSAPAITVDRGPYLNIGTQNSMIVKWRSTTTSDSKVFYGTSVGSLTNTITDPSFVTDHEIKITGLIPSTTYYYAIGSSGNTLTIPSSSIYFKTSPVAGAIGNYKFWVVGDAGTATSSQTAAKTGFLNYTSNGPIDGWLWLGDNAYEGGFQSEYQSGVFSTGAYSNEMKRIVTWPAPGNHDYNNNIPFSPSPAYYNIFTLPAAAEAGGVASGTEAYYSYNYGNIHFISLDSYDQGRNTNDPMATWLTADLTANTLPWVIAYWHHPPYTKGSHNSDNTNFLDGELVDMRQNIIPILENGGVDLVFSGHSHCYERSYLVNGHYGNSSSFNASMKLDGGSGNYPTNCPYQKQTQISKANKGAVYSVCGCSGKLSGTSSGWPHPVFYYATNTILGSMLLEVNGNRLDAKFISSTGAISDSYTIVKNAGKKITLNSCPNQPLSLIPSWPATLQWFPLGVTQNSVSVSPMVSTTYYAYDALSCIKDTFVVNMLPAVSCATITSFYENELNNQVIVYPNILSSFQSKLKISFLPELTIKEVNFYNVSGKKYLSTLTEVSATVFETDTRQLNNGVYFVEIIFSDTKKAYKKIIINK